MTVSTFLHNVTGLTVTQMVYGLLTLSVVLFLVLTRCIAGLIAELNKAIRKRVFRVRQLMTDNEREFFCRLKRALPEFSIFPQVAMAGLIETNLSEDHPDFWKVRNQFAKKICDFVVSTQNGNRVIAVVELDDRTHDPDKDAKRDAMLKQAGLRTVRFESRAKPDEAEIRKQILAT